MAQPAQVNTLRDSDFPDGLASRGDVAKLFQILNPFLQQLTAITAQGTNIAQNVDAQLTSFDIVGVATFPQTKVRIKDGKKPVLVLAWPVNKSTKAVESSMLPGWEYLGAGQQGNQLQINNVPGLIVGANYTVNLLVFF